MYLKVQRIKCFLLVLMMIITTVFYVPEFSTVKAVDDFDIIRLRWKEMLTGGEEFDISDPYISAKIEAIDAEAENYWSAMEKDPDRTYLWVDQIITDSTEGLEGRANSARMTTNFARLKAMALAVNTKGSNYYGNTEWISEIISAVDWMYENKYNENITMYGNGWDWVMGIPMHLNDITILLYDNLNSEQITNYMNAINKFLPPSKIEGEIGANRVWTCRGVALRAIILKDPVNLAFARDKLNTVFDYVTAGDGFYTDGSFIQHWYFAYNGGYGMALIGDLAQLMRLLSGTAWEITYANKNNIYKWVYDGFEPLIYKGTLMDMVRGREISRQISQTNSKGMGAVVSIARLSQFAPPEDAARLKSIVKYMVQENTYVNIYEKASIEMIQVIKDIMNDDTVISRGALVKNKQYNRMARTTHFRPGFAFGISMSNKRIAAYEAINDENKRGWYTGDGMTYLYNDDLAKFDDNFWPTVDHKRLPGITVDSTMYRSATGYASTYLPSNSWAGGTEISGLYGVTGMDLRGYNNTLRAKKSWFMFDDEIVALGAGINSTDNRKIETIVENRKINAAGDNALTVDGVAKPTELSWSETMNGINWAHLEGNVPGADIGYYFPGGADIEGKREARSGKWSDINTNETHIDDTVHTRNYLSLSFNHGANPVDETYSYVLLPNKTPEQVSSYTDNPDIEILANTSSMQVVKEKTQNILGANFWKDSGNSIDMIKRCSRAAAVAIKEDPGNEIEIAVTDPTMSWKTVEIELDRTALQTISYTGVSIKQLSPTIILTANTGGDGRICRAKFKLDPDAPIPTPTPTPTPSLDFSTVQFTDKDSNKINAITEAGNITATLSASNTYTDQSKSFLMLAALYKGNMLTEIKKQNYMLPPQTKDYSCSLTVNVEESVDSVIKVFIWDSLNDLTPLKACEYVEYKPIPTPTPTPPPSSIISEGKPAKASSNEAGNIPSKGNDGDLSTRWCAVASVYPQWWRVDLGEVSDISRVDINWYKSSERYYKYKIEVSDDDETYTTVVDKINNNIIGDTSDSFNAKARYVRVTITGCNPSTAFASFYECKVYSG